jgi:hypothetical protein
MFVFYKEKLISCIIFNICDVFLELFFKISYEKWMNVVGKQLWVPLTLKRRLAWKCVMRDLDEFTENYNSNEQF